MGLPPSYVFATGTWKVRRRLLRASRTLWPQLRSGRRESGTEWARVGGAASGGLCGSAERHSADGYAHYSLSTIWLFVASLATSILGP